MSPQIAIPMAILHKGTSSTKKLAGRLLVNHFSYVNSIWPHKVKNVILGSVREKPCSVYRSMKKQSDEPLSTATRALFPVECSRLTRYR